MMTTHLRLVRNYLYPDNILLILHRCVFAVFPERESNTVSCSRRFCGIWIPLSWRTARKVDIPPIYALQQIQGIPKK